MNIAVYSGSFNPLHIGHLAIMKHLTEEMDFDMVYLIVSPQNPFKDTEYATSGRMRYQAAVEAVARHPELKVKVDGIELDMPAPHYTIRTLDALKEREPENDFTLVIGEDNIARFHEWKEHMRILDEYGLVVFPREQTLKQVQGDSIMSHAELVSASAMEKTDNLRFISAPLVNISSSEIREGMAAGRDMSQWLM